MDAATREMGRLVCFPRRGSSKWPCLDGLLCVFEGRGGGCVLEPTMSGFIGLEAEMNGGY